MGQSEIFLFDFVCHGAADVKNKKEYKTIVLGGRAMYITAQSEKTVSYLVKLTLR